MKEDEVKKQLKRMMHTFTAGSILHLLADLFAESAKGMRQDKRAYERRMAVQSTLFVVGLGIDAAQPK